MSADTGGSGRLRYAPPMRALGTLFLIVAAVLFYLVRFDRQSAVALSVVELQSSLGPVPLYSIVAILGVLLFLPGFVKRFVSDRAPATPSQAGHRPHTRQAARPASAGASGAPLGAGGFRGSVLARLREFQADGARIEPDPLAGVPFALVLEHLSPRSAERAVGELGLLLQSVPLPPRLRVVFHQCPEGPAPRHHLVGKALGGVLDPGAFKATTSADVVEVRFLSPDPRYQTEW